MLVSFELNQEKISELGIPQHVADWHRVRILKEIDDLRFEAMFYGNIDLTAEAMIQLKKLKLFRLMNAKFDSFGKVSSYDNIIQIFDIPVSWYITAAEDLFAYCKRNRVAFDWQKSITDDALRIVFDLPENIGWQSFISRNPTIYPGASSDSVGYCLINVIPTDTNGFKTPFVTTDRVQILSSDYQNSIGKEFSAPSVYPTVKMITDQMKYSGVESLTPMMAYVYRVDMNVATVPEILKCEAVQGYASAYILDGKIRCKETKSLIGNLGAAKLSEVVTTAVSCFEPNYYLNSGSTVPASITLSDSGGRTYSQTINKTMLGYYQWYQLKSVALHNGKTYTFPWKNYPYVISGKTYYSLTAYDNSVVFNLRKKEFYDKNESLFNFPPYYPTNLSEGDFRIRNGILYSDASNLYELEFIQYSDAIIDMLENLAYLQESVAALRSDILDKTYYSRTVVISTEPYKDETRWFYKENGIEYPFLHPVSLQPVTCYEYLNELIFESAVEWKKSQDEINKFLQVKKDQNDYAFNQAYQGYLQGQATLSGASALAEFQRKLKTGLFFYENGYEYWRAFTALELALIEKFKQNALASNEVFAQNQIIIAQNEEYQAQANATVVMANSVLVSEARKIADVELKNIADADLMKIQAPTMDYLLQRATVEGGLPSDILQKWVNENPYYYLRTDVNNKVDMLLAEVTMMEQQVSTAMVADVVAEVQFSKALMDLFTFLKA